MFINKGKCCNGEEILLNNEVICSEGCNTVIKLCLDFHHSTQMFDDCPFGTKILLPVYHKNFTVFISSTDSLDDYIENPVMLPFDHNYQVNSLNSKRLKL